MEDYLRNTLFVEDLLEFLFKFEGISWKSRTGVHSFKHKLGKSPFQPVIGWAFDKLCEIFCKQLKESFSMLWEEGVRDHATFSKYALQEACNCFSGGYTHESFLAYCVQVLGVPGMLYYPYLADVLDSASQVVALVLFSHQMTGEFYKLGGWHGLIEVASRLNDLITYDTDYK